MGDSAGPGEDAGPRREDAVAAAEREAARAGMRLLAAGVPLTLLLDLSLPVDSAGISADEGGSATWLPGSLDR